MAKSKVDVGIGSPGTSVRSLFVLKLVTATQGGTNRDLVSNSWSRWPAESWVPALLEGVSRRAQDTPENEPATHLQANARRK